MIGGSVSLPPVMINQASFKDFFNSKSAGGVILLICVMISLFIANSSSAGSFSGLLSAEVGGSIGSISLRHPVLFWINDGLMAVFFLLVGLEIKRELVEGELSSPRQAALPVFAALGGMLVPALIFFIFNQGSTTANGWGIPMATDIAFAIAIISLLGDRVPLALRIFLTALAIVDDLGAIVVIALFYSADLHYEYLFYAAVVFSIMIGMNRFKVMHYVYYLIPGVVLWYLIHHSGIHATIAGVLTALTIPTTPDATASPLEKLEHVLTKPVNFIIMPLFALANTNITLVDCMVDGLFSKMGLGIALGLILGKPIGILMMSWISVKLKLSALPSGARWQQIGGLGILAGIGFTMSIFVAMLSYSDPAMQLQAKFAILVASTTAGLVGYLVVWNSPRPKGRGN